MVEKFEIGGIYLHTGSSMRGSGGRIPHVAIVLSEPFHDADAFSYIGLKYWILTDEGEVIKWPLLNARRKEIQETEP